MLELFLTARVGFDGIEVAGEFACAVGESNDGLLERRQQFGELRIERSRLTQGGDSARGAGVRVAVVGFVKQIDGAARRFGQTPGVGESIALLGDQGEFARLEHERGEFAHLMAQQIEASVAIT